MLGSSSTTRIVGWFMGALTCYNHTPIYMSEEVTNFLQGGSEIRKENAEVS
jgi:hypothetical protein